MYVKLNCLKKDFLCIKMDLALYHLQWLICHKTKQNQIRIVLLTFNLLITGISISLAETPLKTPLVMV